MPSEQPAAAAPAADKAAAKAKHGHTKAEAAPAPRKVRFNVGEHTILYRDFWIRSSDRKRRHAVPGA
jgi:hypothetical protein